MNHFGYWIFGRDMKNIDIKLLKNNGVTDLFLNYSAFEKHGESVVTSWIKNANSNKINVHIWVQCFYDGEWHNPKTTNLSPKLNEIKKYANINEIKGIHLDYLRYPGNAYKTEGGANAITNFVKKVRSQNPNIFLSCAIMPENNGKYYYGQDLDALGKIVDAVIPMQYKGNYNANTSWLTTTTQSFVKKATIWSGIQGYKSDDDTTLLSKTELTNDIKACLNAKANGVIIFRHGLSQTINFNSIEENTVTVSSKIIYEIAKQIKNSVEKNKKNPTSITIDKIKYTYQQCLYLLSKFIATKKSVSLITIQKQKKNINDTIKENIMKNDYLDMSKRLNSFIEKNNSLPNYITTLKSKKRINANQCLYAFARIVVFYNEEKQMPNYVIIDSNKIK